MEPAPDATRVLVVEDHEVFSNAVVRLLERHPDVRLVGAAHDAEEAIRMLELETDDAPDVVLMDVDLPGANGIQATRRIREVSPEARVVLLTATDDPQVIADGLAAGACGYIPKTRAVDELMEVVRRAAAGQFVMPESHLGPVVDELRSALRSDRIVDRLTGRETQILRRMAAGETTTQIAEHLGISALTVQTHVKSILAKLGARSKIEAVTMAWREGLAPAGD
ncbi:MAG TPA: response regulator transcription factor [Actinomycetota bacterium]